MLGGIAPILIFSFPPALGIDLGKVLGGIPLVGGTLSDLGAIPIPIYLDENLSGIYIESESKSLDIDTDIVPVYRSDNTKTVTNFINQSGINNLVTVNMIANRDSLILSVLLALNDLVFSKLVSGKYKLSYINGTTLIFGGLLHSFSVNSSSNDTLLKIQMQIQKNNQNKPNVVNQYLSVSPTGPAPTPPGVT
jgi:hypothetical protein